MMKRLLFSLLSLVLPLHLQAASSPIDGRALLYSPGYQPKKLHDELRTVGPDAARLIIAERLRLSDFHSLEGVDDTVIEQINEFGAAPINILGLHDGEDREHLFVIVEDVENPDEIAPKVMDSFQILRFSTPPLPAANKQLISNFSAQIEALSVQQNDWRIKKNVLIEESALWGNADSSAISSSGDVTFHHIETLQRISNETPKDKKAYSDALGRLSSYIERLLELAKSENAFLTILLMPSDRSGNRHMYSWGNSKLAAPLARRQNDQEILSTSAPTPMSSGSSSTPTSGPITPPTGILAAYYPSQEDCESVTHFCSGHGKCVGQGPVHDGNPSYYGCQCDKPSANDRRSGNYTNYGGPACQKIDISTPFWLLAGFSIALVFIISWGIGLLITMGNEELPSVIGAGVSGPKAK